MNNPYLILGISKDSSIDEIKKAYKKIALENHPDKHYNKTDDEKKLYSNKFNQATEAYNYLINKKNNLFENELFFEEDNIKSWKDIWYDMINNTDETKDFIKNLAKIFIDKDIIGKKNKNIYKFTNLPITHNITLSVTYNEVYNNSKKKLRLILKRISEPIFIDIYCANSYPNITKIYIDDDDIEHNIIINLKLKNQENITHITYDYNNKIDIVYNIKLNLVNYLYGYHNKILYIDNNLLDIYIPPFNKEFYEIEGKGINNGNLIFKILYTNIDIDKFNNLSLDNKNELNKLLELIY
jgi:DnaJ-class molecular chaperone